MIKQPIYLEDTTIINLYLFNIRTLKYIKKTLIYLKGETDYK
jgi:hypothetical protein